MKLKKYNKKNLDICIVGGGYIGLPLAVAYVKRGIRVTLYDINKNRINTLKKNIDYNYETKRKDLKFLKKINFTYNQKELKNSNVYIITTPTPVFKNNKPDLRNIKNASKTVGKNLMKDDLVIYESTVYPGLTQKVCKPILERNSHLFCSDKDFKNTKNYFHLGYSPERINPGDELHTLEKISKIVSSDNPHVSLYIKAIYKEIIKAKVIIAKDIKTAEAAKVIENTQRDINIAFMNELSIIFNKLNIRTKDVIDLASTKWNFLNFRPGIVGGHCIGVDPYYLTYCAKEINYNPKVILAGRDINDYIPAYIVGSFINLIKKRKLKIKNILIFGASFKENCNDLRNSKSITIAKILKKKKFKIEFFDPHIKKNYIYGFKNIKKIRKNFYSAFFFNVKHNDFLKFEINNIRSKLKSKGLIMDIQNIFPSSKTDFCL